MGKWLVMAGIASLSAGASAVYMVEGTQQYSQTPSEYYTVNVASPALGNQEVLATPEFLTADGGTPFLAFCSDIDHNTNSPWTADLYTTATADYNSIGATWESNLWNATIQPYQPSQLLEAGYLALKFEQTYGQLAAPTAGSAYAAAEYQVAIWEDLYGNVVTDSNTTGLVADAQALLKNTQGTAVEPYYAAEIGSNGHKESQDFIGYSGGTGYGSTPEPFTMSLCAAGLGMAILRRRRSR
jgi:hypothetical protein